MQRGNDISAKLIETDGHFNEEGLALYAEALCYDSLGKLPQELTDHARDCAECRLGAVEISLILQEDRDEIPDITLHPYFGSKTVHDDEQVGQAAIRGMKGPRMGLFFLKLAAGILLVAAISIVVVMVTNRNQATLPQPLVTNQPGFADSSQKETERSTVSQDSKLKQQKETNKLQQRDKNPSYNVEKQVLADEYRPNSELDRLVSGQMRGPSFHMLVPVADARFQNASELIFRWKTDIKDKLTLKIMDNFGKVKLQQEVSGGAFKPTESLKNGLYYWLIGTDEDMISGGRFIVRVEKAK